MKNYNKYILESNKYLDDVNLDNIEESVENVTDEMEKMKEKYISKISKMLYKCKEELFNKPEHKNLLYIDGEILVEKSDTYEVINQIDDIDEYNSYAITLTYEPLHIAMYGKFEYWENLFNYVKINKINMLSKSFLFFEIKKNYNQYDIDLGIDFQTYHLENFPENFEEMNSELKSQNNDWLPEIKEKFDYIFDNKELGLL